MTDLRVELEKVAGIRHECVKEAIRYLSNWGKAIARAEQVLPVLFYISGVKISKITKCRELSVGVARDLARLFEVFFMWLSNFATVKVELFDQAIPAIALEIKFDFGEAYMHWVFSHEADVVEIAYYTFNSVV